MKKMMTIGNSHAAKSGFSPGEVKAIVEFLNDRTGSRYVPSSRQTLDLLQRLYARGYRVPDIKAVISLKVSQWLPVPSMRKYLRPVTLFDPFNFTQYLRESTLKGDVHESI